jgi:hypothetical protein
LTFACVEYAERQTRLSDKQRRRTDIETFEDLRTDPQLVSPILVEMNILDPETKSATRLLRGRRWGKTVLADAWLAFLRKEERLFNVKGRSR